MVSLRPLPFCPVAWLCLLALLLTSAPGLAQDHDLRAQQVADGVYVLAGANGLPDRDNQGRVGNLGFLVGDSGVVVIDTGSSRARGKELLAAIAAVTPLPVKAVLITHPAQEFLFGIAAFTDRGIPVYAHPDTPRLMRQRCDHCLETLNALLGERRMLGTRLDAPAVLPQALPAFDWQPGGRALDVHAGPPGAVPGNLWIRDRRTGVVFSGALLSVLRVPAVQDTRPADWQAALQTLLQSDISLVVPAYGPVAARHAAAGQVPLADAVSALAGYLAALDRTARQLYQQDVGLAGLGDAGELRDYADWASYPANHRLNVFYRYLQLETEDLAAH